MLGSTQFAIFFQKQRNILLTSDVYFEMRPVHFFTAGGMSAMIVVISPISAELYAVI